MTATQQFGSNGVSLALTDSTTSPLYVLFYLKG
jgi:hypothetical protein